MVQNSMLLNGDSLSAMWTVHVKLPEEDYKSAVKMPCIGAARGTGSRLPQLYGHAVSFGRRDKSSILLCGG